MIYLFDYLILGAFAGILAGLLGIGGGLVIVPVLLFLFTAQSLPTEYLMQLAVGTSMATIILTSASSLYAHHQHGALNWTMTLVFLPGIIIGSLLGPYIAHWLPSDTFKRIFGVFEIILAIQIILATKTTPHRELPHCVVMNGASTVIGTLSSMLGMGGGAFTVPYLVWHNVCMRNAIPIAAALGFPISIMATLGYIAAGWNAPGLPENAWGYIYLPAFIGIIAASVLFAPLGAKLAHSLPVKTVKRFFGVFLLILGVNMLFDLF